MALSNAHVPHVHHVRSRTAAEVALFAVIMLGVAAWHLDGAAQPYHWPTTTGRITQSMQTREIFYNNVDRYQNWNVTAGRFYIEYNYTVMGKSYASNLIDISTAPGRRYPFTGEGRYPLDSSVTVRYDPRDPSRAVLETGVPWQWVLAALLALGMLALALTSRGAARRAAAVYRAPAPA